MQHLVMTEEPRRRAGVGWVRAALRAIGRRLPPVPSIGRMGIAYARDLHGLRSTRTPAGYVSRLLFFWAAGRFTRTLIADAGPLRYEVRTDDHHIGRSLFVTGDWDPLQRRTAFAALNAAGYADFGGCLFLDIGANIGCTSLPAITEHGFAAAIAYEPERDAYALLLRNATLNGLADRIEARNVALGERPGRLRLAIDNSNNGGDHRVVVGDGRGADGRAADRRDAGAGAGARRLVTVVASTVDAEVAAGRVDLGRVGLVWLDVQGHEAHVLAGAQTLLRSPIPVVLEFSTELLRAGGGSALLPSLIAQHYAAFVDLGACAGTGRIRFRPAADVWRLAASRRPVHTDLLLLKRLPERLVHTVS